MSIRLEAHRPVLAVIPHYAVKADHAATFQTLLGQVGGYGYTRIFVIDDASPPGKGRDAFEDAVSGFEPDITVIRVYTPHKQFLGNPC